MNYVPSDEVEKIRGQLDHPVIDGDGHLIEYTPLVRDFLVEIAGPDIAERFDAMNHGGAKAREVPLEAKRGLGISRFAWWGVPTRNTLDRATAMMPKLMYERMDELGLDYALLFPTYGLTVTAAPDDELRPALARAYNRYYAECYGEYRDRLEPVAAIPCFSPQEAITELDYAVGELGLKAAMFSGVISRTVPGAEEVRGATWIDTLCHDSDFDYDPLWKRCEELGVAVTFHSSGQGWGTRMVADELRLQPHWQLRRGRRSGLPLDLLRRRRSTFPEAALRLPRGWRRLGLPTSSRTSSDISKSATATRSPTTTQRSSIADSSNNY